MNDGLFTFGHLSNMSPEEEESCHIVYSVQKTIADDSSKAVSPQTSFEADPLFSDSSWHNPVSRKGILGNKFHSR